MDILEFIDEALAEIGLLPITRDQTQADSQGAEEHGTDDPLRYRIQSHVGSARIRQL